MGVLGEPCPFSGVDQQCIPHTYMARGSGLWFGDRSNAVRLNNKYKLVMPEATPSCQDEPYAMREYDEVGWLGERATQR